MDNVAVPSPGNPGRMVLSPRESPGLVLSPKENSGFDPYAFPADDQTSFTGSGSPYATPLHLSVHPKTFLPPGNPSTNMRAFPEKGLEPHQSHLPAYLHSPTQGAHPVASTGQQFNHPSSKLQHDSLNPSIDSVHLAKQASLQATGQQFNHPSSKLQHDSLNPSIDSVHLAKQASLQATACQTSVFSQQTEGWQPQAPKKKAKQKAAEDGEAVKKKVKKPKKSKEVVPSLTDPALVGNSKAHTPGDVFGVGFTSQPYIPRSEPKVLCAKNAAPTLPASMSSKDGNIFPHSLQSSGSFTLTTHTLPSTTTAATFTNSIQFYSEHRRQSTDSQELSTSRPASRTSTMSSASSSTEVKPKEPQDPIPMSKILEIIEREKLLGSSSPCKRRRTAKPQHIQEAEEEAKKFAAANAVQGVTTGTSPADKHSSNSNSQDGIKKSSHNSSSPGSIRKSNQANCSEVGGKRTDTLLYENSGGSPAFATKASSPHVQLSSQCSNDSFDSQPVLPSGTPTTDVAVSKSSTPAPDTSTPHLHPQVFSDQLSAVAAPSSRVPSDVSELPAKGVAMNVRTYALSDDTSVEKQVFPFQSGSPKPPNSSVPLAHSGSPKINGSLISPSHRENTHTITPHSPHHTGKPVEQPFPSASTKGNFRQFDTNRTALEQNILKKQHPHPPSSVTKGNFQQFELNHAALDLEDISKEQLLQSAPTSTKGHFQQFELNHAALDLEDISKEQLLQSAPTSTKGHFQQFEINRAAMEEKIAKEKILKDLNASRMPTSLRATGSGVSYLQSTIESLLQGSSTTSTKWMNGSLDASLPGIMSSSAAPESAMHVKVQDLEPSLTCDLNTTWSQTAHMISGIDTQQPPPPPLNSTTQVSAPKKAKKKRSPNKAKAPQLAPSPDNSLPDSLASSGALPPFGAFAGFKMEPVHPAFGSVPANAYHHHLNSQANHTLVNSGVTSPGIKKRVKKPSVNQMQPSLESMDRKLLKGSPALQEPLRDNSNLKTAGGGDFLSSGDSGIKIMKAGTDMHTQNFKPDVHGVSNTRQIFHSSGIPNTEKIDLNGSKPYSDYHTDFKTGSNGIIQQKTVTANTAVNTKPENFGRPPPHPYDNNSMKAALNGFKDDSGRTQIRAQPVPDTWPRKQDVDSLRGDWSPYSFGSLATQSGFPQSVSLGQCSPQSKLGMLHSSGSSAAPGDHGHSGRASLLHQSSNVPHNNASGRASSLGLSCTTELHSGIQLHNGIGLSKPADGSSKKPKAGTTLNGAERKTGSTAPNPVNQSSSLPPFTLPTLEPSLAHMSPEEELDERLRTNKPEVAPKCNCLGPNYEFNESIEGPYYTQLGAAKDVPGVRQVMEKRTGLNGNAIRIEKIHYTGKEGRSSEGCPIAKWIIRRSGPEEKYLCVARKRPGHFCDTAYIIVVIVAWEGVDSQEADSLYGYLVSTLTKNGFETDRRCATNERKTCACQGVDLIRRGASFSFGCSWSMYFNGCKFARSHIARKFKLKDTSEEEKIEEHLQELATQVGPLYKAAAPDAYRNQTKFEEQAGMCRLGSEKGKPFSGVTACVDFCAHSHKDFHNMQNGSTVVVTLTKHRGWSRPEDEQLHVLPLYVMDNTDEGGSIDGQMKKMQSGALEILHKFSLQARMRATPLKKPKRGAKKDSPAKSSAGTNTTPGGGSSSAPGTPTPPTTPTKERDMSFLHSQDSSQSQDGSLSGSSDSAMQTPEKRFDGSNGSFEDRENSQTCDDFMSQSFGPSEMYEKVWQYYYNHGAFPPQAYMEQWAAAQKQAMMNPQNNGANMNQGSNMHKHHQPSSQQNHPQAATDFSQTHLPPGAQHQTSTNFTPGIKTEAANSSDLDQEIINLTHKRDHSDSSSSSPSLSRPGGEGSSSRSSEGRNPSRPLSVNADGGRPAGARYASPLDLLTEAAASMEASMMSPTGPPVGYASTPLNSRPSSRSSVPPHPSCSPDLLSPTLPRPHSSPGVQHSQSYPGSPFVSPKPNCDGPPSCNESPTHSKPVMPQRHPNGSFVTPTLGQGPEEPTFTMIDPTVVRCEWQDNTQNFHDPGIGGVAIALSHGAVLFEVAKRELHATTALKNPNRYQPTRISLVFYQHKNLNFYHHGYYEYERKLATQRKQRIEKLMEEGATAEEAEKAVKPGRKRKKKEAEGEEEEEKIDFAKTSAAQYRYMWDTTVRHGMTLTTDSIITRWIDPQPMVTGPYQRWV